MAVLVLSGDLRLQDAPALMRDLGTGLTASDVDVDTGALASADAAIALVLLSAFRTARVCGRKLTLGMPPQGAIEQVFGRLGLLVAGSGPLVLSPGAITGLTEADLTEADLTEAGLTEGRA